MKSRIWFATALLVLSSIAYADDPQKKPSDEEMAMHKAMMAAMTPGAPHKLLDGMVGSWDATVKMWMEPGAEPMTSKATSESKWILGNRFIEERFNGEFMGMPFTGLGYNGYDNVRKQYWGTWMDSMSTGTMLMTGNTADNGKNWTFTGTNPDPMTGKEMKVENRVTVTDADHHTMEMWSPGPDGKPFKMMEISYSRKK